MSNQSPPHTLCLSESSDSRASARESEREETAPPWLRHTKQAGAAGFLTFDVYLAAAMAVLRPQRSSFLTVCTRAEAREQTIRNDNRLWWALWDWAAPGS